MAETFTDWSSYTFARYHLPHDDADDRDFDKASFGIVKILSGDWLGTAYPGLPWEPSVRSPTTAEPGTHPATRGFERISLALVTDG